MQTIVLRFDYHSSTKIESLQTQANAGNLKKVAALPPHITIQSYVQTNPIDLKLAIQAWADLEHQFTISFSSIGFFKQHGTFFLSPVKNDRLAAAHQSVLLATSHFTASDSLYQSDRWVPHTTIATQIATQFWGPLFYRLALEFEPFTATVTAIECWSINEGRTENEWSLFFSETD